MSPKKRILRVAATAALALATAIGMTLPAGAATAPASGGHATVGAGIPRPQVTFGPIDSENWAGYATVQSPGYITVASSTFQLPSTSSCSYTGGSTYSPDIAIGMGGLGGDSTTESAGVEAACGSTGLITWHICVGFCPPPPPPGPYADPDDIIEATISYLSGDEFRGVVQDLTQGWSYSSEFAVSGALRGSAEAIVADTTTGSLVPLRDFGIATFHSVTINGSQPLTSLAPQAITMVSTTGTPMAAPSSISSGGAFSVAWESTGP